MISEKQRVDGFIAPVGMLRSTENSLEPMSILDSVFCCIYTFKNAIGGWARWLTPVIPTLWEVKAGGSLGVRSSRPAWPTW